VNVLEVIQRSTEFLDRKGIDSPRLQTELLLAHLLQLPRMQLYLNFERSLVPAELDRFRQFIKRRAQHEPLQQIVGGTSFCGLEMAVNRHVLVPRPETELLAEHGWLFLNQLPATSETTPDRPVAAQPGNGGSSSHSHASTLNYQTLKALDFGTGSGCVAIALAVKSPAAEVYAIEILPDALALARQNAARHGVAERIQFLQGDGLAVLPQGMQFDLIVSNPPYVRSAEIDTLQPEVRDYEPRRALDGGADGLDYYRRLAGEAQPFLKPGARIMLEFGDGQAKAIAEIFQAQKWIVEAVQEDYTKRPRILIARRAD
jgi:release factor glutamine methyltransferase